MPRERYDGDVQDEKRGVVRVLVIAAAVILCCVGAVTLFNYVWVPYSEMWASRTKDWNEAYAFINDPETPCTPTQSKLAFRHRIGDLDKCKDSTARIDSSPAYSAFKDLMTTMQVCPEFDCMYMNVNIFGYLHLIFVGIVLSFAIGTVFVVLLILLWIYRFLASGETLPFSRVQRALSNQARENNPPPGKWAEPVAAWDPHTKEWCSVAEYGARRRNATMQYDNPIDIKGI